MDRETALKRMKEFPSRRKKLIAAIKGATASRSGQMSFIVELEREEDGRWIAEVVDIPGALAYGQSQQEALARVQAVALRVIAEKLDQGEIQGGLVSVSFVAQ